MQGGCRLTLHLLCIGFDLETRLPYSHKKAEATATALFILYLNNGSPVCAARSLEAVFPCQPSFDFVECRKTKEPIMKYKRLLAVLVVGLIYLPILSHGENAP